MKRHVVFLGGAIVLLAALADISSAFAQQGDNRPVRRAVADKCASLSTCVDRQVCRGYRREAATNYCANTRPVR